MVTVTFGRDSRQRLSSVFAVGHTDWSENGTDIVCAAVSAILQAARLGLEQVARVPLRVSQDAGTLALSWDEGARDNPSLDVIVRTAEVSLAQISAQYPQHVAVRSELQK